MLLASFVLGTAILPVSRTVRWWIVLLAGLSWPFAYAVKLGQVGPLLFLLFAVGWRWLDGPIRLGVSMALGTAIKLQPGDPVRVGGAGTAVPSGPRWRGRCSVVLALAATLIAGAGAWSDFLNLVRQVGDPITTPHNLTPGAVAYQLACRRRRGVDPAGQHGRRPGRGRAAARFATAEASYLVAVIASQLVSPILWDHYAMLLLLPVAYLCARGSLVGAGHPTRHRDAVGRHHAANRVSGLLLRRAGGHSAGRAPGQRRPPPKPAPA